MAPAQRHLCTGCSAIRSSAHLAKPVCCLSVAFGEAERLDGIPPGADQFRMAHARVARVVRRRQGWRLQSVAPRKAILWWGSPSLAEQLAQSSGDDRMPVSGRVRRMLPVHVNIMREQS